MHELTSLFLSIHCTCNRNLALAASLRRVAACNFYAVWINAGPAHNSFSPFHARYRYIFRCKKNREKNRITPVVNNHETAVQIRPEADGEAETRASTDVARAGYIVHTLRQSCRKDTPYQFACGSKYTSSQLQLYVGYAQGVSRDGCV